MISRKKKNELTVLIGRRIAFLRRRAGLSQQDVEDRAVRDGERTIKFRTLSLIEQGYGEPKITTLYDIASALKVPLSELLKIGETVPTEENRSQTDKAVRLIHKLDGEHLRIAIRQLEAFNKKSDE